MAEIWFQSHAGSIEAALGVPAEALGQLRFNPTLVRLRRAKEEENRRLREGFNPTLVRLRRRATASRRS